MLTEVDLRRALVVSSSSPTADAWAGALRVALLAVGMALVLAGVVFFFAYNWASLGRLAKLSTVGGALLAAGGGVLFVGPERPVGKALLFAAAMLTGVLLAVYGQAYQTGADSYLLFGTWAVLVSPWALGAASWPVLVLLITLLEITLLTYWDACVGSSGRTAWLALSASAIPLTAWLGAEAFAGRVPWLSPRGLARLFGLAALFPVTLGSCAFVLDSGRHGIDVLPLVLAVTLIVATIVRYRGRDAFLLAAAAASTIAIVTTALGHALAPARGDGAIVFLSVGLALVVEVGAATAWLRIEARKIGGDA